MAIIGFLTPALVKRILIGIYCAFVVIGLITLCYGIYLAATTTIDLSNVDGMEVNGFSVIFESVVNISLGALGLLGVLQKKRILLYIIIGVFSAAIVTNIVVLIVTVTTTSSTSAAAKENIRTQMIKDYGNYSDPTAKDFSLNIDSHQTKAACCGFAGDEAENLFLKTPWYRLNNHDNSTQKRNLPDVCCLVVGAECRYTENLQQARDQKLVYQYDCFTKMNSEAKIYMWTVVIHMTVTSIMQALCIGLNVLNLLENDSE